MFVVVVFGCVIFRFGFLCLLCFMLSYCWFDVLLVVICGVLAVGCGRVGVFMAVCCVLNGDWIDCSLC